MEPTMMQCLMHMDSQDMSLLAIWAFGWFLLGLVVSTPVFALIELVVWGRK